jgi:hypothetical protein
LFLLVLLFGVLPKKMGGIREVYFKESVIFSIQTHLMIARIFADISLKRMSFSIFDPINQIKTYINGEAGCLDC